MTATPHALLTALHRAAIQGVSPFPRTQHRVAEWLAMRGDNAPVHVLALGKAAPDMAAGALHALRAAGVAIAGGLVVAAHRPSDLSIDPLPLRVGDHPIPDIGSLAAADAIANSIAQIDVGDDVLVLLSGGSSSLCAAPCAELVSLVGHPAEAQTHLANAMQQMMDRGLAIHQMNAIRRRLLRWGAGRLATAIHARGARATHVLAFSDVLGDDPAVIGSAPCTADPLLYSTVLGLCDAFGLRTVFPAPIARALGLEGSDHVAIMPPAATHPAFTRVTYEVIASNAEAQRAAVQAARSTGIEHAEMVDVLLEGEAESLGGAIAQTALSVARRHDGAALLVFGGEPVVMGMHDERRLFGDDDERHDPEPSPADDDDGNPLRAYQQLIMPPHAGDPSHGEVPLGGRMQALALDGAVSMTDDAKRITILAAGTDGRDGPTDAAGAIVDANSALLIRRAGRDPARDLQRLRSYKALDSADALLRTGPTGTNVMDIVLVFLRPATPRDRREPVSSTEEWIMWPGKSQRRS